MKKLLMAFGLIAFGSIGAVNAQIQQGNTMWGGSITDFNIGLKKG